MVEAGWGRLGCTKLQHAADGTETVFPISLFLDGITYSANYSCSLFEQNPGKTDWSFHAEFVAFFIVISHFLLDSSKSQSKCTTAILTFLLAQYALKLPSTPAKGHHNHALAETPGCNICQEDAFNAGLQFLYYLDTLTLA